MPDRLAQDICRVQPITGPCNLVFGLRSTVGDNYNITTKAQFATVFQQGRSAAERGWERLSPYSKRVAEGVWYEGYDSSKFVPFGLSKRDS